LNAANFCVFVDFGARPSAVAAKQIGITYRSVWSVDLPKCDCYHKDMVNMTLATVTRPVVKFQLQIKTLQLQIKKLPTTSRNGVKVLCAHHYRKFRKMTQELNFLFLV